MQADEEFVVSWPTLGFLVSDWIEAHCVVPDGFRMGEPWEMYAWQLECTLQHYRVKPEATIGQLAPAFHYRRSLVIAPQKQGKGPWSATMTLAEAAGPVVFNGWANGGEVYRCSDWGCGCGFEWEYEPGDPMGRPWPSPLIQLLATSQDQVDNVYRPLQSMVKNGPLQAIMKVGEEFTRVGQNGRIDVVTSSAMSRLGNPITFAMQDEALALDTPIPTPSGWTTMGEVAVGDEVLGSDGRPVRVVKATQVQRDRACYRVEFRDGTSIVASDGHLWATKIAGSAALPRVRTTGEMAEDERRFRIPMSDPLDLPEADLPAVPYLLGLWLGDGHKGCAEITAHLEEVDELRSHLADEGVWSDVHYPVDRAAVIKFSRRGGHQACNRPAEAKALQALSCYRDKHIPAEYFRGSRGQREALLQGLMDSDGHVTETGFCTFAGNARLASDMVKLLRTFGIHARAVRHEDPRARTGEGWKVNFLPRKGLMPFRLARKVRRVRQASSQMDWESVVSIEPVESVPVRCVGVDSDDHLFLAGDGMHVTHNTGLYNDTNKMRHVATTMRRGLAGMGGRAMETTNPPDPSEDSVAQRTLESPSKDIFKFWREPPKHLSFRDKRERRQILRYVYKGSDHIDIDSIDAEAAELLETDPAQAERFFGNRMVYGAGAWCESQPWDARKAPRVVPAGEAIVVGFDGSDSNDWTGIRCQTREGYQFTPSFEDGRPMIWNPAEYGGQVPRLEVAAAVKRLFATYKIVRFYADPPYWESEIDAWAEQYGDDVVLRWATYRPVQMHAAAERLHTDIHKKDSGFTHDGCPTTATHVRNARKAQRPSERYVLAKPSDAQKIDLCVTSVICNEAFGDVTAADLWPVSYGVFMA